MMSQGSTTPSTLPQNHPSVVGMALSGPGHKPFRALSCPFPTAQLEQGSSRSWLCSHPGWGQEVPAEGGVCWPVLLPPAAPWCSSEGQFEHLAAVPALLAWLARGWLPQAGVWLVPSLPRAAQLVPSQDPGVLSFPGAVLLCKATDAWDVRQEVSTFQHPPHSCSAETITVGKYGETRNI